MKKRDKKRDMRSCNYYENGSAQILNVQNVAIIVIATNIWKIRMKKMTSVGVLRSKYNAIRIQRAGASFSVGRASKRQIPELADAGYKTAVCYGWESARDTILEYLNAQHR